MNRRMLNATAIAVALFLMSILASAQMPGRASNETKAILVSISKPEVSEISREVTLVGSVDPDRKVTITPKATGKIEKILVDEGDTVKKGQLLAVIEKTELELAVRQAEAMLKSAQAGYDQAVKLAKVKAESQLAQAEAALTAARVRLEQVSSISESSVQVRIKQAESALDALKANLEKIKKGAREEEIEQVRALVDQARAGYENARENYERMSALFEKGVISAQTMDGVKTQYEVAKAQYEAATQQLKVIEKGAREEDIRAIEAQVRSAEANLELARLYAETKSWEKDAKLAETGVVQAEAALNIARTAFEAETWKMEITLAESQLEQARVGLDMARERLGYADVTAPFDGVITSRMVDEGAMAAPGSPMFQLIKMDKVEVTASVSENEMAFLKPGMPVKIATVLGVTDTTVDYISPIVDSMSRAIKIKSLIDNTDGRFRPGMSVEVTLPLEVHRNTLIVPRTAVIKQNGDDFVYTVSGNVAKLRKVKLGLVDAVRAEIVEGLSADDQVVVAGQNQLTDGSKIRTR